ncbi:MAG: hypothetical protein IPJ88_04760 [Myxococcales bacterium]|nr:MAG: hypothetical protein IPJ88_04760 [Myxococcales bacterium]
MVSGTQTKVPHAVSLSTVHCLQVLSVVVGAMSLFQAFRALVCVQVAVRKRIRTIPVLETRKAAVGVIANDADVVGGVAVGSVCWAGVAACAVKAVDGLIVAFTETFGGAVTA